MWGIIKNQLKAIIVLLASVLLSLYIPIKFPFLSIEQEKISETLNLGVYTFLTSVLWDYLCKLCNSAFLHVSIQVKTEQNVNTLVVREEDVKNRQQYRVTVMFDIRGKKWFKYDDYEIVIDFPDEYMVQLKKSYSYAKATVNGKTFSVDLNKMNLHNYNEEKLNKINEISRQIEFVIVLEDYNKNNKDTIYFNRKRRIGILTKSDVLQIEQM